MPERPISELYTERGYLDPKMQYTPTKREAWRIVLVAVLTIALAALKHSAKAW